MSRAKKFLVLAAACAGILAGAAAPALISHPPSVAEQSPGQIQANRQGTSTPATVWVPSPGIASQSAAIDAAGPVKPPTTGPDQGNRHGT